MQAQTDSNQAESATVVHGKLIDGSACNNAGMRYSSVGSFKAQWQLSISTSNKCALSPRSVITIFWRFSYQTGNV
jgi:hypothetical protein